MVQMSPNPRTGSVSAVSLPTERDIASDWLSQLWFFAGMFALVYLALSIA